MSVWFPEGALIFDDIGSYPLPKGVKLDALSEAEYFALVGETMEQKIAAGVEVPNYPQFRDMIKMFMDIIASPTTSESPYLVKRESAQILELKALDLTARHRLKRMRIRACVTGPIELYLSAFGSTSYTDILYNLAESVARFLEGARNLPGLDLAVVSLDEPSLGISPSVVFSEEEIQKALEIASFPCRDLPCEIHLHSSLFAELCCQVPTITILGVESAAHPDYLRLIDKRLLEETDTYLRVGIARTDILAMAAGLNDRLGINLWTQPDRLEREILSMESPQVMERRLSAAHRLFGERIKAAGPDCGLGSWPSQTMAREILHNCASAIDSFRSRGT